MVNLESSEVLPIKIAVSGYAAAVANRIARGDSPEAKAATDQRRLTAATRIADAIAKRPFEERANIAYEIEAVLRREWDSDYVPEQSLRTGLTQDAGTTLSFDNSYQRMIMLVGVLLSQPKEAKPDTAPTRTALEQVFTEGEGI